MTSGDNGGPLYPDILRSISHVYGWSTWKPTERAAVDVPLSAISKYTGTFTTQQIGNFEITLEAGRLHASLSYYGSSPLYPSSPDAFFATDAEAELYFDSADSGKLSLDHQSIPFTRVK